MSNHYYWEVNRVAGGVLIRCQALQSSDVMCLAVKTSWCQRRNSGFFYLKGWVEEKHPHKCKNKVKKCELISQICPVFRLCTWRKKKTSDSVKGWWVHVLASCAAPAPAGGSSIKQSFPDPGDQRLREGKKSLKALPKIFRKWTFTF